LEHGIISVGKYDGEDAKVVLNLSAHVKWVTSRATITFAHTLPCYIMSLWRTKATRADWLRLGSDLLARVMGKELCRYALDASPTKSCVFVEAEIEDTEARYSQSRDDIIVVGNPDFIHFNFQSDMLASCLNRKNSALGDVMYVECGMTAFGVFFKSQTAYCEYIGAIAKSLKSQGYRLLFKLKPQGPGYESRLRANFAGYDVDIVGNVEFMSKLSGCVACITEPSSLGILPCLLGMPVLLNQIAPLDPDSLGYGDIFTAYPRSICLTDPDAFTQLLEREHTGLNPTDVSNWIRKHSGPLPASDMPKRVAGVVLDLVKQRESANLGVGRC